MTIQVQVDQAHILHTLTRLHWDRAFSRVYLISAGAAAVALRFNTTVAGSVTLARGSLLPSLPSVSWATAAAGAHSAPRSPPNPTGESLTGVKREKSPHQSLTTAPSLILHNSP